MVNIPLKVKYGIMAALELAIRYGSVPVQARVIARRQVIPLRFSEQILQSLKKGGIVESLRGCQGGYSLRKSPPEVSLTEIVEAISGSSKTKGQQLVSNGQRERPIHHDALLSTIWDRVRYAELEVLNSITLQSLVERYNQMEQGHIPMYHI